MDASVGRFCECWCRCAGWLTKWLLRLIKPTIFYFIFFFCFSAWIFDSIISPFTHCPPRLVESPVIPLRLHPPQTSTVCQQFIFTRLSFSGRPTWNAAQLIVLRLRISLTKRCCCWRVITRPMRKIHGEKEIVSICLERCPILKLNIWFWKRTNSTATTN